MSRINSPDNIFLARLKPQNYSITRQQTKITLLRSKTLMLIFFANFLLRRDLVPSRFGGNHSQIFCKCNLINFQFSKYFAKKLKVSKKLVFQKKTSICTHKAQNMGTTRFFFLEKGVLRMVNLKCAICT